MNRGKEKLGTPADRPLRGAALLVQRIRNRDEIIDSLRLRIAELEAHKKEARFEVHVDSFYWYGLTHDQATKTLKDLLDLGVGKYARIVEDP